MPQDNPHTAFVNRRVEEEAKRRSATEKESAKVPPLGMEHVPPRELRKRFPHMGDDARRKLRESLASKDDPTGSRALLKVLHGEE